MANGVISLTSTKSNLEGRIVWESTSNGATANNSNVVGSIQVRRNDGYTTKGTWSGALTIHETTNNFSNSSISVGSDWVTMEQFTVYNVPHKTDGSGACWISGWCNAPSGTSLAGQSVEGSSTVTLDKIARYLSITSFEIRNITINTAQVFWSTDVPRSSTLYYLNDDGTGVVSATYGETVASDQKSGSFYVKGLSPNTQYSIKISCTRTDNGLVTTTGNKTFSTYNIATINQAPNFNIGENPTINWNNPGGCRTVAYAENIVNGNIESKIAEEVDVSGRTSYTYSLNASTLYSKVPNSNSGTIRYVIKSSNDGKDYWATVERNYYVTNSNPIFSNFTFKDTNSKTTALTGNNQKFIKGYSSLQATVSTANKAVAKNSATMKNYTLTVGTKNSGEVVYSSSADVNLSVSAIDNNVVFVTAKDSRQNTTAVQKTISNENYYTYTDLTITKCTLTRSDGGVGTQVTLNYEGAIWNKSFGSVTNAIVSIKYEYKIAGTNTWTTGATTLTPTVSGSKYSQTILIQGDLAGSGFNDQNSYDFRLTVSDKLSTKQFSLTFGAGTPLVAYSKKGVSFGAKYDEILGGILQAWGNISFNDYSSGLYWKEPGYGDQFKIVPSFSGEDDSNYLAIKGATGGAGTRPELYDLLQITGKSGNTNIKGSFLAPYGFMSIDGGQVSTPVGNGNLIIKKANNSEAPNNGVVLEFGNSKAWTGQLYIGDNSYQGIYYNGWSNGVRGTWRRLADAPVILYDNASGTTGTVTLSQNVTNFSFLEIIFMNGHSHILSTGKVNNTGTILLQAFPIYSNSGTIIANTNAVVVSGTSITRSRDADDYGVWQSYNNSISKTNQIKIIKVLGWR